MYSVGFGNFGCFNWWIYQILDTEPVVESDEDVPVDEYYVAKGSKKKEKKRQERDAQRQVHCFW